MFRVDPDFSFHFDDDCNCDNRKLERKKEKKETDIISPPCMNTTIATTARMPSLSLS
jgi:hypothetical protein